MRLIDLHPKWIGSGGAGVTRDGQPVPRRERVGIQFDCPCGKDGDICYIPFRNPPDGGPTLEPEHPSWYHAGDTFETLVLTPSIQRMDPGGCRWHGYITNGEIVVA